MHKLRLLIVVGHFTPRFSQRRTKESQQSVCPSLFQYLHQHVWKLPQSSFLSCKPTRLAHLRMFHQRPAEKRCLARMGIKIFKESRSEIAYMSQVWVELAIGCFLECTAHFLAAQVQFRRDLDHISLSKQWK
ncbi:hypothetical protein CFB47_30165 [Burkholderia sp. AU27893]|uniref:Uncharacterized protein n=1 Tax=Burkholderia contaminans TaxID=488447 RepID=A0A2S5E3I3_9BURK|nr:hypothetical protein CFB47_30165 [Burkholderia sp. AU27893]POZ85878.1 hypothetical protein C3743_04930 [Burkholderia contaminans]